MIPTENTSDSYEPFEILLEFWTTECFWNKLIAQKGDLKFKELLYVLANFDTFYQN